MDPSLNSVNSWLLQLECSYGTGTLLKCRTGVEPETLLS